VTVTGATTPGVAGRADACARLPAQLILPHARARRMDKRKGFTETDYARFLDFRHQHSPARLVRSGTA